MNSSSTLSLHKLGTTGSTQSSSSLPPSSPPSSSDKLVIDAVAFPTSSEGSLAPKQSIATHSEDTPNSSIRAVELNSHDFDLVTETELDATPSSSEHSGYSSSTITNISSEPIHLQAGELPTQPAARRPRSRSSTSKLPRVLTGAHSSSARDSPSNTNSHLPSPVTSTRSMFSAFPSRPHTLFHLTNFGSGSSSRSGYASSSRSSLSSSGSDGSSTLDSTPTTVAGTSSTSKFRIGPYGSSGSSGSSDRFGSRGRYDTLPNRKSPLAREVLSGDEAKGTHSPFSSVLGGGDLEEKSDKGKARAQFNAIEEEERGGLLDGSELPYQTPSLVSDGSRSRSARTRSDSVSSARDLLVSVQERLVFPSPSQHAPSHPVARRSTLSNTNDTDRRRVISTTSPHQQGLAQSSTGLLSTIRQRTQSLTPIKVPILSSLWGTVEDDSKSAVVVEEPRPLTPPTPTVIVTSPSGREEDFGNNPFDFSEASTQVEDDDEAGGPSRSTSYTLVSDAAPALASTTTMVSSKRDSRRKTSPPSRTLHHHSPSPYVPKPSSSFSFSSLHPHHYINGVITPGAFPPLDPSLAELERSSRLLKSTVRCAVCGDEGKDFPRCGKCGEAWCSRGCRVEGLRREKEEEGRAGSTGKRHVCRTPSETVVVV